jgi:hypothetical protein
MGYGTALEIYHYIGGTAEDEGSRLLLNVSKLLPHCAALYSKWQGLFKVQLLTR